MIIRDAVAADAGAIAAIYNDAVLHTTAIWNEITVDAQNRVDWLAARQAAGFAVLVADVGGAVAGYAAYGPWRAFDGFRATVEHSIYVAPAHRGQGIARALMAALVTRARDSGIHVMVGAIEAGNAPSIALHRAFGFGNDHVMRQVGQKFGRWLDLMFVELRLDDRPSP